MSVCRSKNTETEKHALIKKSISISDFFFVRECFNSSYLLVLSEKKKPSDQVNWSIEGDFITQSCCLFRKT